ncbi:ABC transporter permease [Lysinibacter sp. HNR]|uniref:ABC transporter permease n=1 Tax=Lysinibacter sp. HNR TaxID=3031408 RepID=UPI002434A233|nr:ABC transporter permease [Lysinibacter sp. HNR]WGD37656.1 ABC transporter permease [Lysinibacter sp. HNR]
MSTFASALRAEFLKILSTRLWWFLALIMFGYVGLTAGFMAALLVTTRDANLAAIVGDAQAMPPLDPLLLYSFGSSVGFVFPVIFAAMMVTQEFRHKTVTPTFLANPNRIVVLTAKSVTAFVWGAVYGVVAVIASAGVSGAVLAAFGIDTEFGSSDTWAMLGRVVLVLALWGLIGVGLGSLIPSQVGSIITILVFTQFVEPLLRFAGNLTSWSADIAKFLPGAAGDALVGISFYTMDAGSTALLWWAGGLVLLAYAIITTAGGYFVSWRRDVS